MDESISKIASKFKVNFLVAGVQKAGTTALFEYLKGHAELSMATPKETHFFDDERYFENKEIDYKRYHTFFNDCHNINKLFGEATPIYTYWYDAPKRIWNYNPSIKIIVVLRNPIERAFSHWNMERDRNFDLLDFHTAIRNEANRCREALPLQHRVFSYIDRGFYTEQLRRIWHYFPKDQTLILKHEDLKDDLDRTLLQVSNFLKISKFKKTEFKNIHSRAYKSSLDTADHLYLRNIFIHDINELESLLGWDCSDWLQ